MRTTIDLPDALLEELKPELANRNTTMRAFVISALQTELHRVKKPFKLKDGAVGDASGGLVSTKTINDAIDEMREPKGVW